MLAIVVADVLVHVGAENEEEGGHVYSALLCTQQGQVLKGLQGFHLVIFIS